MYLDSIAIISILFHIEVYPILYFFTECSQVRNVGEINELTTSNARPVTQRLPGLPHYPRDIPFPQNLLFNENGRYDLITEPFTAVITRDNYIVGRVVDNIIYPIFNKHYQIVKVDVYTKHVRVIPRDEISMYHFHHPYRAYAQTVTNTLSFNPDARGPRARNQRIN